MADVRIVRSSYTPDDVLAILRTVAEHVDQQEEPYGCDGVQAVYEATMALCAERRARWEAAKAERRRLREERRAGR